MKETIIIWSISLLLFICSCGNSTNKNATQYILHDTIVVKPSEPEKHKKYAFVVIRIAWENPEKRTWDYIEKHPNSTSQPDTSYFVSGITTFDSITESNSYYLLDRLL